MQLPLVAPPALTVAELNRRVRVLLENQFETLLVTGELSNVKPAASGHWYFCLKDEAASIDCVMYRSRSQFLDFRPENGVRVEVRARVTLYEPRGSYQLTVDELRRAGRGPLHEAFEKLKARLAADGLFEPERKRSLPAFPRAIGIVTSREAAALRDMLIVLRKRSPMTPVILYPAPVQGEGAAAQIARAIRIAGERGEVDVLIVGRGGGSLEDLWAFNEEVVARAIDACPVPVVSGVGHETDFTIADFVADVRAPTPTAAAALVGPDREALGDTVAALRRRMTRDVKRGLETRAQRLDGLARRLLTPAQRIERQQRELANLARRMGSATRRSLADGARQLSGLRNALTHLDPTRVLGRGYSIVRDADGHVRRTSAGLAAGAELDVTFGEGGASVTVRTPR